MTDLRPAGTAIVGNERLDVVSEGSFIKRIGNIIKPLLDQGQSPYEILNNHPEIGISEKTLYSYIESGLFKSVGIDIGPLVLRRQVNRKIAKDKAVLYKPRHDFSYLKDRKYGEECRN